MKINEQLTKRFWEIDFLRSVAVVTMVCYHALFDLVSFNLIDFNLFTPLLDALADLTAATFFVIVGVSLYISYSREKVRGRSKLDRRSKFFSRGLKLFLWGLIITGVTFIIYPDLVILFGALHFIGTSIILGYSLLEWEKFPSRRSRPFFFLLLCAVILILNEFAVDFLPACKLLLPLAFTARGFQSLDYFPLIPWFAYVLLGMTIGEAFYTGGKRHFSIPDLSNPVSKFVGSHALLIYLAHQPILYGAILLYSQLKK